MVTRAPDDRGSHRRVGRAGPGRRRDQLPGTRGAPAPSRGGDTAAAGASVASTPRPLTYVHPRRARCTHCASTQLLLPANVQPRLADATEVIGTALASKAAGHGHRRIATALDRSPSTVRRWMRR